MAFRQPPAADGEFHSVIAHRRIQFTGHRQTFVHLVTGEVDGPPKLVQAGQQALGVDVSPVRLAGRRQAPDPPFQGLDGNRPTHALLYQRVDAWRRLDVAIGLCQDRQRRPYLQVPGAAPQRGMEIQFGDIPSDVPFQFAAATLFTIIQ